MELMFGLKQVVPGGNRDENVVTDPVQVSEPVGTSQEMELWLILYLMTYRILFFFFFHPKQNTTKDSL